LSLTSAESWAQKGPTVSPPTIRPLPPTPRPLPSNSPGVLLPKVALPNNTPRFNPALLPTHAPAALAAWHKVASWHQTLWTDGWYLHRRARHDHHFAVATLLHFNPWVDNFLGVSPLSAQYYWYHFGVSGPPYYNYYVPSVTYRNTYGSAPNVLPSAPVATPAYLEVVLPDAEAKVWFGDHQTTSLGTMRFFTTPALQPGTLYSYTVKASWTDGGKLKTAERVVYVTAGSQVVVDFTALSK
jgi:uncharacterized protein (TIGR03000 family)